MAKLGNSESPFRGIIRPVLTCVRAQVKKAIILPITSESSGLDPKFYGILR